MLLSAGDSFLSLSSDMEAAYREYLANYSAVTTLERSYQQQEQLWTQMVALIKASAYVACVWREPGGAGGLSCAVVRRPEVNATSLSFFLVMPVQRIARYPLLLQTVQKHTHGSHPALGRLQQAAHTAVALNCRINEYKRFREVGARLFPPPPTSDL